MNPTPAEILTEKDRARAERRDPRPLGEKRVRVILTLTGSFTESGVLVADGQGDFAPHERWPLMAAKVERECWESEAERLVKMVETDGATERELEAALVDHKRHVADVAISDAPDAARDGIRREILKMTGPEILQLTRSGRLVGKTPRPYRPSFQASFVAVNYRDIFPLLAVEVLR